MKCQLLNTLSVLNEHRLASAVIPALLICLHFSQPRDKVCAELAAFAAAAVSFVSTH
jgi:hypothetical protein